LLAATCDFGAATAGASAGVPLLLLLLIDDTSGKIKHCSSHNGPCIQQLGCG
jgi:hypothetical protein